MSEQTNESRKKEFIIISITFIFSVLTMFSKLFVGFLLSFVCDIL